MLTEMGWRCLDCPEKGSGDTSDKAAEKHGKAERHSTMSWTVPAVQNSEQGEVR